MKTDDEIRGFLTRDLYEKLLPIELYRKKKIGKVKGWAFVSGIFLILSLIFVFIDPLICGLLIAVFFFSMITTGQNLGTVNKQLRIYFKTNILKDLLNYLYDDCIYIPTQRISRTTLEKSLLIAGSIQKV
ncbi:MAG TPA: hypothetical protein VHO90_01125, partial [Bacteroidales bacterium]|nr:hypothetical protein [Bacteroidales bacterium]